MARLKGFEPPTHGLEGRCSIQLSYRRKPRSDFLRQAALLPLTVAYVITGPGVCQALFFMFLKVFRFRLPDAEKSFCALIPFKQNPLRKKTVDGSAFFGYYILYLIQSAKPRERKPERA